MIIAVDTEWTRRQQSSAAIETGQGAPYWAGICDRIGRCQEPEHPPHRVSPGGSVALDIASAHREYRII
jgi:hypothetical protein